MNQNANPYYITRTDGNIPHQASPFIHCRIDKDTKTKLDRMTNSGLFKKTALVNLLLRRFIHAVENAQTTMSVQLH